MGLLKSLSAQKVIIHRNIQIHEICVWKQDEFSNVFNISAKSLHRLIIFLALAKNVSPRQKRGEPAIDQMFTEIPSNSVFFVISPFVSFMVINAKTNKLIQTKLMLIFLHFCPFRCISKIIEIVHRDGQLTFKFEK